MPEWLNGHAWRALVPETGTQVRILSPPPRWVGGVDKRAGLENRREKSLHRFESCTHRSLPQAIQLLAGEDWNRK